MGIGKFFFHHDSDDLCRLGDCLFGVERRKNGGLITFRSCTEYEGGGTQRDHVSVI